MMATAAFAASLASLHNLSETEPVAEAVPLSAGLGDGSVVLNIAEPAEQTKVQSGVWAADGQSSSGLVNNRGGTYAAGATFSAARCS